LHISKSKDWNSKNDLETQTSKKLRQKCRLKNHICKYQLHFQVATIVGNGVII